MPWTEATRHKLAWHAHRYATDLTAPEWALIAPLMPAQRELAWLRETDLREVVNAILYIAATGCQWRMLPRDLPPPPTMQRYFYDWRDGGLLRRINHRLVVAARELEGREVSPTAGVIDSQSAKTTWSGGPCGFDADKKLRGRKRDIFTDTLGLLVGLQVHAGDVQDRDGAPALLGVAEVETDVITSHSPTMTSCKANGNRPAGEEH